MVRNREKGGHRYDDTYDAARIVVYFQRPSDGWRDVWQRDGIIVVGTLLDNGKITYPGDAVYESLCNLADLVLVEGDGSRRLPLKVMAHEPVIPKHSELSFTGWPLSALGKTVGQACFRYELLGLADDTVITEPSWPGSWKRLFASPGYF